TMLEVEHLKVTVGAKPILGDISFAVSPGEIVGLVGESGSGKSMTLLSIMRLLPPAAHASGAIRLNGTDLMTLPERAMQQKRGAKIGMVFQEPMTALNPVQTIGHQLAESFMLHKGLSRREAMAEAAERLKRVGLAPDRVPLERYPHQL